MKKLIFFLIILVSYCDYAQDGYLDTSFNSGTGFNSVPGSLIVQSDDKIVVVGTFTSYNGTTSNRIIRLNPGGTIDTSFNPGGTGANNIVTRVFQLSDGKFLIAGEFTSYNGISVPNLAKLNNDGTLDTTFNIATLTGGGISAFAVQADNKIIVGGSFQSFNGTNKRSIARLNSDGSLDLSFTANIAMGVRVEGLVIQNDSKIIVAGDFDYFGGMSINNIVRINSDGTIDPSFNVGTGTNEGIKTVSLLADNKIIISGNFHTFNGSSAGRIVRLNNDGSRDNSFTIGTGASFHITAHKIQNDGKIIIIGDFSTYNGVIAREITRLNSDGTKDTTFIQHTNDLGQSFNLGGMGGYCSSLALQNDQKIIVVGDFNSYNSGSVLRIARLTNNTLSINEHEFTAALKVFPNPSSDIFTINIDVNATIEVSDLTGKIIENKKISFGNSTLDMSGYNSGMYLLKIITEHNQSTTVKLLKN